MTKKVAIIILHWGDPADTTGLLKSLQKISYDNYQIYLVDQTLELDVKTEKNMRVILPETNLGYSGGNNLAISIALEDECDYLLLLNNDTIVESNFLQLLVRALESDENAAAAGPTILYGDDSNKIWFGGGEYLRRRGSTTHLRVGAQFDIEAESNTTHHVSFITGCSILLRSSVVREIGMLDDSFFLYWEDADWCVRAADQGYGLVYVPKSVVYHRVSSGLSVNSPQYLYYIFRNNLLFIRKHISWPWKLTSLGYLIYKLTKETAKIGIRYRRNYGTYARLIVRAFSDNAKRRYGKL